MNLTFFKYQAFDSQGKVQAGQVNAESEREAIKILKKMNLTPIKIGKSQKSHENSLRRKISNSDLLDFTNGLCTLVEARVPLDRALRLLDGITDSPVMKNLVLNLLSDVKEGKSLASAMEAHPAIFSKMYINIIRAGEEGGILHELLPDLAEFLETSYKTRQEIISAMNYPIVLLATGIISVFLLLIFVVPQFAAMFEDSGSEIPSSAAFLLIFSEIIQSYGIFMLLALVALIIFWRRLDRDYRSKLRKHEFLLSLPLIGALILYKESAIFSRTLGALLGAGIPLIRGLRVSKEVVFNTFLVGHLDQVEEEVGAGLRFVAALDRRVPRAEGRTDVPTHRRLLTDAGRERVAVGQQAAIF